MLASDVQVPLPLVNARTSAATAGRLISKRGLPGVVLADEDGRPLLFVSATEVLGLLASEFSGAGSSDEALLGDLTPSGGPAELPTVPGDLPIDELAQVMLHSRVPLALVDGPDDGHQFASVTSVIDGLLAAHDDDGPLR